jgi:hypothetical protein
MWSGRKLLLIPKWFTKGTLISFQKQYTSSLRMTTRYFKTHTKKEKKGGGGEVEEKKRTNKKRRMVKKKESLKKEFLYIGACVYSCGLRTPKYSFQNKSSKKKTINSRKRSKRLFSCSC